jgi:hypothetical protein
LEEARRELLNVKENFQRDADAGIKSLNAAHEKGRKLLQERAETAEAELQNFLTARNASVASATIKVATFRDSTAKKPVKSVNRADTARSQTPLSAILDDEQHEQENRPPPEEVRHLAQHSRRTSSVSISTGSQQLPNWSQVYQILLRAVCDHT